MNECQNMLKSNWTWKAYYNPLYYWTAIKESLLKWVLPILLIWIYGHPDKVCFSLQKHCINHQELSFSFFFIVSFLFLHIIYIFGDIYNTAVKSKSGMIFSFPPSIAPQGMARWWWTGGLVFCLDKMQVVNLEQARLDIN